MSSVSFCDMSNIVIRLRSDNTSVNDNDELLVLNSYFLVIIFYIYIYFYMKIKNNFAFKN